MKKNLLFLLAFIFYSCISFSKPLLRAESEFYFVSDNVNFINLKDKNLLDKINLIKKYNMLNNVNLEELMSTYKYHLVFEEINGRSEFLILFELDTRPLARFISNNTKFNWKKIYKDRDVAFDAKENYIYSFNKEFLIISNSVSLFFKREEISYYKNYTDLLNLDDLIKLFSLDEPNYNYAYINIKDKEINYIFDDKSIIKSINFENVDLSFENKEENLIETLVSENSLEFIYKEQNKIFSYLLHKIFPDFEFLELEDKDILKNTYGVIGEDFVYGISEFENQEKAINTFRDIVSSFVFFTDYKLSLGRDEDIFYIELPLIYEKLYIKNLNNSNKLIFSNSLPLIKSIENLPKLDLVISNNKKYYINFEQNIKIQEYNEENINIKIKERI